MQTLRDARTPLPIDRRPATAWFPARRWTLTVGVVAAVAAGLGGCQAPGPTIASKNPTDAVATLLIGDFSSAEQAQSDQDFREIDLHVVRVWPSRVDGPWLYIEQAVASEPLKPYRQRIYQLALTQNPDAVAGTVESRVYELPGDPLVFAGAWSDPARFADVTVEQLVPREGCTVYLVPNTDGSWSGGTDGNGCSSALRGASYATSEVTVSAKEMRSWDRGWDKTGKQVWGAEKGAYIFKRAGAKKPDAAAKQAPSGEPERQPNGLPVPGSMRTTPSGKPIGVG